MAAVLPLGSNDRIAGSIGSPGEVDEFQVTLTDNGRLTAAVQTQPGCSLDTRLSLLGPDHQLLVQSDGRSVANRDDLITQHLLPGTYFVQVEGLARGSGDYTLTTQFAPANPPNLPLLVDFVHDFPFALSPWFSATGDFNGDGALDLATANSYTNDVTLLLGLGDGTFHSAGNFRVGNNPYGLAAGDFDEDGILDLAAANQNSDETVSAGPGVAPYAFDVSILLGNGDGSFAPEQRVPGGNGAYGLFTADLNHDRHLDLIITNQGSNDVSVLLGNGDATFQPDVRYPTGDAPNYVSVGDFNQDGYPDLAVENYFSNTVSLLLNNGDGTFGRAADLPQGGNGVTGVAAGDFNADGRLDLATANSGSNTVDVYLNNGGGTFQSPISYAVGSSAYVLLVRDFNADGRLDLAVTNRQSNDISVLLGNGDGTFREEARYRAGLQPLNLVAADFNGDGRLDLAAGNGSSHDISLLLGLGDGTFQDDLTDPRRGQTNPQGTVVRDFNGDSIADLAVVSYTGHDLFVFLGRGDGTFGPRVPYEVGSTPVSLVAADFNGDGELDLVTSNCDSADLSVLLGRGDGTFQDQVRFAANASGEFMLAGDFTGDGHLDLIDSGEFSFGISLIPGNGDGTFRAPLRFGVEDTPAGGAVGDFNRDGKLDLAVTNFFSPNHDVSVFLGNNDGTFQPERRYAVGEQPFGIIAGDFTGDGKPDLVTTNLGADSVSLLPGLGDGTFAAAVPFATGPSPDSLFAADFDRNGWLDLVVSNASATDVSLLLGQAGGTFQTERRVAVSDEPTPRTGLAVADFNGDGRLDLLASQILANNVVILPGRGDGSFQAPLQTPVGLGPSAFTTGDFNNDGRLDVASVNPTTEELRVSLGLGDATLQNSVHLAVGAAPAAVVKGDFNRDGRLDLAAANYSSGDVSVLLGLGDGTFRQQARFAVGTNPVAVVAGDFNGDGVVDLATANAGSDDLSILLNRGDGTFREPARLAAGDLPDALVAGDFDGDGRLDLAFAAYRSQDVRVCFGRGNGTFMDPVRYALGTSPVSLAAADFNGDAVLDLATANYLSDDIAVLLGQGGGAFGTPVRFEAGTNPVSVTSSDVDGDGHVDLATANSRSQDVSLLRGRGDGTFAAPVPLPLGDHAVTLAGEDFTDDGHTDLAVATQFSAEVSILQGLGELRFVPGGTISNPIHATPLVMDFDGDGLPDVAVVSRQGKILLRLARPGAPGVFEAPGTVNPDPATAARDLAVVSTPAGPRLAALDARRPSLSLYAPRPDGTFTRDAGPTIPGILPVALAAGDLNGDGLTDLVVADAGSDEVLVYLQTAAGDFGPTPSCDRGVGISPSALDLVDVDGDGRLDIVVTNQFSGDVSVLRCGADAAFAAESRFRAGVGLTWLENHDGKLLVRSRERTAGLVTGEFDADPGSDLVAVNSGANSFSVLSGNGLGGFLNPVRAQTYPTGLRPTVVVTGRFNNDPHYDLAVLNEKGADLSIFLADDRGGFIEAGTRDANGQKVPLSAGNLPTGVAAYDANGDGRLDLLVGNDFGDVLTLLGNGDGTFQPYQRTSRNIALAVADLNGDGREDFIFGNEARDRVTVQYSSNGLAFTQERGDGVLAPGAVSTADLNHDGRADLVIANGGANNVLVYLGLGNGQFGLARSFFAGTNPASVTAQDLSGDGRLDLVVANEGSNDVTILFSEGQGDTWTLTPGPRLRAGLAPVSTTVSDVTGDGIADLLVSNSQSRNVSLLPGVGGGFFNDQGPRNFATGLDPRQAFVGAFDASPGLDLVSINAGSNNLTFVSNFLSPLATSISIASGGSNPVAALAGDFNGDGLGDLLVANNGDGVISLLLGQEGGLSLRGIRSLADLAHPTALALADMTATGVDVYVAGEDTEAVRRLSFDFGPIALATNEARLPPGAGRAQVADLLPLQDTTVAIVAALPTVRRETDALSDQQQVIRDSDFLDNASLLLVGGSSEPNGTEGERSPIPDDQHALLQFLLGRGEKEPSLSLPTVGQRSALSLQVLDDWLPGILDEADGFWQLLAKGSVQVGETSMMAWRLATAPWRASDLPLPELPLATLVDNIARDLLKMVRPSAEALGVPPDGPGQGAQPPVPGVAPLELPPPQEKKGPLREDEPQQEGSSQAPPSNLPDEESIPAVSLVMALFASGLLQAPGNRGGRATSRRTRQNRIAAI